MRTRLGAVILLLGLLAVTTICDKSRDQVTAGPAQEETTVPAEPTSAPPATDPDGNMPNQASLCADLEGVLNLASEVTIATSAGNLDELGAAFNDSATSAERAARQTPDEVRLALGVMATALRADSQMLSAARPKDLANEAVVAALADLLRLFEGETVFTIAAYQANECGISEQQ